jgi:tRNA pseudouridine32 synthase/23S rRNA pseudouridine746 synthase
MRGASAAGALYRAAVRHVFDNPHFIAVDKPAGVLTVPSRLGAADPRPCAGRELEAELGVRLWPVHRLDLEVSGLVLFAKHPEAHRAVSAWFEGRDVHKHYQALTEPGAAAAPTAELTWRSRLLRGKKRAYESPHGKDAQTRARCVGRRGEWLLWQLEPLTGRPHQLRVHLVAHGFVIAGDTLYGATRPWSGPGIALRAVRLDLSRCDGREVFELPDRIEVPGL